MKVVPYRYCYKTRSCYQLPDSVHCQKQFVLMNSDNPLFQEIHLNRVNYQCRWKWPTLPYTDKETSLTQSLLAVFKHLCRITGSDGICGDVLCNNRSGTNAGTISNCYTWQYNCIGSDANILTDIYICFMA